MPKLQGFQSNWTLGKKRKKSIREILKVGGFPKSTVGYIKKQVHTGKLEIGKWTGKPRSTILVDDWKIIYMVNKNPFMSAQQVKNALQDVGVHVWMSREDFMTITSEDSPQKQELWW